jgi:uncharacterized protein (TIGR02246 family)
MNSSMTRAVGRIAVATAFAVAVCIASTQGQDKPDAAIQKIADDFAAAWGKGDAAGLAALHAEDAVRLNGDGSVAKGRAAIQKGLTDILATTWKGTRLTITPGQLTRVTDDVYVGEGKYQITGGTPPPGAPTSGSYMNTMVRRGGRWVIVGSVAFPPPPGPK